MSIPKAVLYYSPISVWSAVVLLALEEKGYGQDEIDRKQVDLGTGDNFDPTFLRLNPRATVPVLVAPMQKTLTEDIESRYKAITETEAIVAFLDKSRSAISRTHTTSNAPAPTLTPATIALSTICKSIIDHIHSADGNPNNLRYFNARDDASLCALAEEIIPDLSRKHKALSQYISDAEQGKIHVSVKTSHFWDEKKLALETLLDVLQYANKATSELDDDAKVKRTKFYQEVKHAWEVALRDLLTEVNNEIIGPYCLGDQFSIADLHLAGWIARLVKLAGGTGEDDGSTALAKLENYIANDFSLPKDLGSDGPQYKTPRPSKLGVFWDMMKERRSWKRVYGSGIY